MEKYIKARVLYIAKSLEEITTLKDGSSLKIHHLYKATIHKYKDVPINNDIVDTIYINPINISYVEFASLQRTCFNYESEEGPKYETFVCIKLYDDLLVVDFDSVKEFIKNIITVEI